MLNNTIKTHCALLILTLGGVPAFANPLPVVSVSQINGSPWMPTVNLINGVGFDNGGIGDTYDPSISFGDTQWRAHYSERNSGIQLLFDVGSVQAIGQMDVWNYYEGGAGSDGRSIKHTEVSYSSDNVGYTSLGVQTLLQQPSPGYDASSIHTTIPLGVDARYVKLSFSGDAGDINYGDVNWWGLNEVRFTSAVPEPAALSLLACGLAVVLACGRRKQTM